MRTEEQQKEAVQKYERYFEECDTRERDNVERYDRATLTLTSASLGFTVLVANSIVPLETADFKTLLYTCWGALLLSIITSLAGYRIGNRAIKEARKNAADYYLRGNESARTRENKWTNWNVYNNYITGFIFIFALACLLLFIIMNIHSVSPSDCVGGSF